MSSNTTPQTPNPSAISVALGYPEPNGYKPSMCRKLAGKPVEKKDRNGEYSSVYIADMIFYGVGEPDKDAGCKTWQCRMCPSVASPIKQVITSGYQNLIRQHVQTVHEKEWKPFIELLEANEESKALRQVDLMEFVDKNSLNVYDWLKWIVVDDLPLTFVNKETTRKYSRLSPISYKTLKKYLHYTVEAVKAKIKQILDGIPCFGLMFDGSTAKDSTHYMCVYAILPVLDYAEKYGPSDPRPYYDSYMLAFSPLLDEEDFGAESHAEFISSTLREYGKDWKDVAFIVTDNENLNKAVAKLSSVPMVGCASHRLSLAIKTNRSGAVQTILDKLNNLMKKLRTKKGRGALRKKTGIAPKKSMPTRWSGDKMMVESFSKLENYIDEANRDFAPLIPNAQEKLALKMVNEDFKWLYQFTVALQSDKLNLAEARCMLDAVLSKFPDYNSHIAMNSAIVYSPVFEKAVIRVLKGQEFLLSGEENEVLGAFRKEHWLNNASESAQETKESSDNIAQEILKKSRKEYAARDSMFIPLNWIPPTSVKCERSFSWFGNIHTNDRQSMKPETAEDLMMLKCNPNLWDSYVVATAIHQAKNEPASFESSDDEDEV